MKTTTTTKNPFVSRSLRLVETAVNVNLISIGLFGLADLTHQLIAFIERQKGQFRTVTLVKILTVANKGLNAWSWRETGEKTELGNAKRVRVSPCPFDRIVKVSRFQIRLGIAYENKESIKTLREQGKLPEPPKGKEWLRDRNGKPSGFPYWMESLRTGQVLLAGAPKTDGFRTSEFFTPDFLEIKRSELVEWLPKKKTEKLEWITCEFRSIIRIK